MAWKCDTRVDFIDYEMAVAMRKAGCFMIAVGLESGSPLILDNIKKGINLDKSREGLLAIKKAGILCYTLLMIGNVGESDETIKETVRYLNDIKPHLTSWVAGVMVLPDTEMDKLNQTGSDFWVNGDDLPYYTKESSMEDFARWSGMLSEINKEPLPDWGNA